MQRETVDDLIRLLEEDAALAQRMRQVLLTRELLDLPEHVAALVGATHSLVRQQRETTGLIASLVKSVDTAVQSVQLLASGLRESRDAISALGSAVRSLQQEMTGRLSALEADVAVLKADVATLKQDVATLKQDVATLKQDMAGLREDVNELKGLGLEQQYRDRAYSYFAPLAVRIRAVDKEALVEQLEQAVHSGIITDDQSVDAIAADVVATGVTRDGTPVAIVAEVSYTIDAHDVERAERRAQIVAQALRLSPLPVVAGRRISPGAEAAARDRMWRLLDGRAYAPGQPAPVS